MDTGVNLIWIKTTYLSWKLNRAALKSWNVIVQCGTQAGVMRSDVCSVMVHCNQYGVVASVLGESVTTSNKGMCSSGGFFLPRFFFVKFICKWMSVPTVYTNKCMGRNGHLLHLLSNSLPCLKPIFSFYGAMIAQLVNTSYGLDEFSERPLRLLPSPPNPVKVCGNGNCCLLGTYSYVFRGMGSVVWERSGYFLWRKIYLKIKLKKGSSV
jgi:hypothetical protein